jgi:sulfopropanediol 3-dehydrogenase
MMMSRALFRAPKTARCFSAAAPLASAVAPSSRFLKSVKAGVGSSPGTGDWAPGDAGEAETTVIVNKMLARIREGGDEACLQYARELDGYSKATAIVTPEEVEEQTKDLHEQTKDDVRFQRDRVQNFAKAQLDSLHSFESELFPGVITGQKVIPVETAGCYIPGGRFSHVSSAIMSVCTAKVAGVKNVIATSPAMAGTNKIHPGTLYAMQLAGADHILCLGGVQGIGALAYGCFTGHPADVLAGPGNKFVAEAKRLLFGRVGIDMFAGPTEVLILADETADPWIVANDAVGQAEHGLNSPAWVFTTCEKVGKAVAELVPKLCAAMPEGSAAAQAWEDYGEVVVLDSREEMAALSDHYAAEHLQVIAEDLDWWLGRLTNYGSLFLGEETQTTFGDKCSGTNHVLPTKRVSRYSGGLSVDKFVKKVTYQRMTKEANKDIAVRASRISRLEGMEGHARSCDVRLAKYFPETEFDLTSKCEY